MSTPKYLSLLDRVRAHHAKSAAASAPSGAPKGDPVSEVKDPTDKGVKAAPTDPSADPKKQQVPASQENGPAAATLETSQLKAEGTGTAEVPATQNGDKQDAAVTSPTDKLASAAQRIRAAIDTMKAASKGGTSTEAPKDPAETKAPAPGTATQANDTPKAADPKPADTAKPAEKPAAVVTSDESAKQATEIEPDVEILAKLARTILSIEGGHERVTAWVKEAKGREIADDIIRAAVEAHDRATQEESVYETFFKNASADELALMEKCAAAHGFVLQQLDAELASAKTDDEKQAVMAKKAAYVGGAQDAAAMEDNGGELPGAEAEISDEQIMAVLQAMVESGELPPEVLEQIMAQIGGGQEPKAASVDLFNPSSLAGAPECVKQASAILADTTKQAAA